MDCRASSAAQHRRPLLPVTIAVAVAALLTGTAAPVRAYDVLLRWTVPPEPDIAEYFLYSGTTSSTYAPALAVGALSGATLDGVVYYLVPNVPTGTPTYFAVTACNTAMLESDYSNEKVYALTDPPAPRADAGLDQHGVVGSTFTVGGAASPGVSYFWEQIAGPAGTFTGRTSSSSQFSASAAGTVVLALTAYDAADIAARDTVSLSVDPAVPSPTASWTHTATLTPTRTHTPTVTATRTQTPTLTPTRTHTPTSSPSPTLTATPTASWTHTPTLAPTRTDTPTRSPSPTHTSTPTASWTHTPTLTTTPTKTPTQSPSPTCTATPTASATRTPTSTSTPTYTPTQSPVPTHTATPTASWTRTPTATAMPTDTPTQSPVPTHTATPTATRTHPPTATAVPTDTASPTATRTSTPTATTVPRHTPTQSPVPTATATRTPTVTVPPTNTATTTPTRTPTSLAATVTPTRTPSPSPTPGLGPRHRISGFVGYFGTMWAVPRTLVEARGTTTLRTDTDPTGQFTLDGLEEADWRLQPSKQGDTGNAVSALDAVYVLQALVGARELCPLQRVICDVTGNGTLSALDASLILRRVIGAIDTFPMVDRCGSEWVFEPVPSTEGNPLCVTPSSTSTDCRPGAITFNPLDADVENQSFLAAVVGDCTGNWQPTTDGHVVAAATAREPLHVSVRQGRGGRSDERRMLITIDTATPVYAVTVDVRTGSDQPATGVRVRTVPAVPQLVRAVDDDHPGAVRVALASAVPLRSRGGAMLVVTLSTDDGAAVDVERVKINEGQSWTPPGGSGASVR